MDALTFHVHVRRRQLLQEQVPCYCESTQTQSSRPYSTATCYLHTAIWLGTCQSILTKVERSSEQVLVCHRISPFIPTISFAAGPVSWNGRRFNLEYRFCLGTHLRMKMQTVVVLGTLLVVLHINVGDAMFFHHPQCPRASWPGTRACTFQLEACDASHGM